MGQGSSQEARGQDAAPAARPPDSQRASRRSTLLGSLSLTRQQSQPAQTPLESQNERPAPSPRRRRRNSLFLHRFASTSQLSTTDRSWPERASTPAETEGDVESTGTASPRRREALSRSTSNLGVHLNNMFRRTSRLGTQSPQTSPPQTSQQASSSAPRLEVPPFAEPLELPNLTEPTVSPLAEAPSEPPQSLRSMSASLRRRTTNSDDTSAMLTRILSAAAAATAMSLTGASADNMGSLPGLAAPMSQIDGDDGSFLGFLQSLRSGRLANALGQDTVQDGVEPQDQPSLEFLRMFRFGSTRRRTAPSPTRPSSSQSADAGRDADDGGRMVPVLIVGIRALNDREGNEPADAMSSSIIESLATTNSLAGSNNEDRDDELDPDVRRNRRSTIGGLNFFSRDNRMDELRPTTSHGLSETPPGPFAPPTTPASPGLSALSSGATTPTRRSSLSLDNGSSSRRDSLYRRLTGTALEPTLEEQSQQSPRQRGLRRRPRIQSWTDGPRHDPRRNGMLMEPGDASPSEGSSTRSWIIYILGGNYPENHPILRTPSLFTDSPSYEDMLMLASFLGSAKPPVAKAEDVKSAGGMFKINLTMMGITARSMDGDESFVLPLTERCQVCLSEYLDGEQARRLVSCKHVFHQECIDQWLTTGRNSCPLCRTQGVAETAQSPQSTGSPAPASPAPA